MPEMNFIFVLPKILYFINKNIMKNLYLYILKDAILLVDILS